MARERLHVARPLGDVVDVVGEGVRADGLEATAAPRDGGAEEEPRARGLDAVREAVVPPPHERSGLDGDARLRRLAPLAAYAHDHVCGREWPVRENL